MEKRPVVGMSIASWSRLHRDIECITKPIASWLVVTLVCLLPNKTLLIWSCCDISCNDGHWSREPITSTSHMGIGLMSTYLIQGTSFALRNLLSPWHSIPSSTSHITDVFMTSSNFCPPHCEIQYASKGLCLRQCTPLTITIIWTILNKKKFIYIV